MNIEDDSNVFYYYLTYVCLYRIKFKISMVQIASNPSFIATY